MNKKRNSSIELLKIFAMILIVISHVTQTLYTKFDWIDSSYIINLKETTSNIQHLILSWFASFGAHGNVIFFVCSAWFLLDSKKVNKKKILYMLANVWIINIIILIIFKIGGWFNISTKDTIKCILPTTFELNWYITYYILFYCIHTFINIIIENLSQKQLFTTTITMLLLYYGIDFLQGTHFAYTNLVGFIVIYFIIAYMKLYLPKLNTNSKANKIGLLIGIFGTILLIIFTNILGTRISYFSNKLTHWNKNNNPFILLTAICLFNLCKNKTFQNNFINYISNLTLLIYIIHENLLVRTYLRPLIWLNIYNNIGYAYVLLLDIIFAILLFISTTIIAFIYKNTLEKIIYKICDKLYEIITKIYNNIYSNLSKIR